MVVKTIRGGAAGLAFLVAAAFGTAGRAQEPAGFRLNNLTVSPYVNLEYNYDSNVDLDRHEYNDSYLTVNPGVDLTYTGNDWGLSGNAWYGYDKYLDYTVLNEPRYGERLSFYTESAKGWRLVLGESYMKSRSNDSVLDGGRGIWRERDMFELSGALAYQVSEKTGVTLDGQYSDLNYKNDNEKYGHLYGWEEWSAGLELAHRLTEKSNLLLNGGYQEYHSNGAEQNRSGSTGYSLMGGFGSRATERVSYRALTGVSWFDYGEGDRGGPNLDGEDSGPIMGWTYSLDANWLISRKWAASVAGSSYFQPSETEQNQAMQVYTLSGGVTYRPFRRLTLRGDLGYRREDDEFNRLGYHRQMTDDIFSARFRADYQLQRYVSVYGALEYQDWKSDESLHEYDRFLGTLGLKFRY
jgi:hypothetical protein